MLMLNTLRFLHKSIQLFGGWIWSKYYSFRSWLKKNHSETCPKLQTFACYRIKMAIIQTEHQYGDILLVNLLAEVEHSYFKEGCQYLFKAALTNFCHLQQKGFWNLLDLFHILIWGRVFRKHLGMWRPVPKNTPYTLTEHDSDRSFSRRSATIQTLSHPAALRGRWSMQ